MRNPRVHNVRAVFSLGRPGSLWSPSGYPLYCASLRARSYPCRDRASGQCRHNPFGHGAGAYKKHTARSSAAYTPSGSIFQSACRGWR
ncbi:MAG: hypothetical protein IKN98_09430 [Bacteroidales bacterium]|nr:hypothetical protein [Bacteroidales bacterium]